MTRDERDAQLRAEVMAATSAAIRKRVEELLAEGWTPAAVQNLFTVEAANIARWAGEAIDAGKARLDACAPLPRSRSIGAGLVRRVAKTTNAMTAAGATIPEIQAAMPAIVADAKARQERLLNQIEEGRTNG